MYQAYGLCPLKVFRHPWNEAVQSGQGLQSGTQKTTVVSDGFAAIKRVSLNKSLSQGSQLSHLQIGD